MGQKQSYYQLLPESQRQKYQPTKQKRLFKHKGRQEYLYVHTYPCSAKEPPLAYYQARQKLSKHKSCSEHILSLKKVLTKGTAEDRGDAYCAISSPFGGSSECNIISMLHEYHPNKLETEIINRQNIPFRQQQIWSVVCSSIVGAHQLTMGGFKEPILSPKAIMISSQGYVKVGQWEFVNMEPVQEEGQIILENSITSKQSLLINYYWAPEGPAVIDELTLIGSKLNSNKQRKSQIFSLGMTVLQMCLRKPLYRCSTFTENQIEALIREAISKRNRQKHPMSEKMLSIIRKMLKWDFAERPSYFQLYEMIKKIFQNGQLPSNNKSQKTLQDTELIDQTSYLGVTIVTEVKQDSIIGYGVVGDDYNPSDQSELNPAMNLQRDKEDQIREVEWVSQSGPDLQNTDKFETEQFVPDGKPRLTHSSSQVSFAEHNLNLQLKNLSNNQQQRRVYEPSFHSITEDSKCKQRHSYRSYDQRIIEYSMESQSKENFNYENERLNNDQHLFTDPKLLSMIRSNCQTQQYSSSTKKNEQESDRKMGKKQSSYIWPEIRIEQNEEDEQQQGSRIFKETYSRGHYEGEKKKGMRNGFGTFYYNEGGKYVGHWADNKMTGRGTLYYLDNRVAYEGEWFEDQLHGIGKLYNEKPQKIPQESSQFYDYRSFDQCQQYWVSYSGEFHRDDKHGKGELILSNGQRFVGNFKSDVIDGTGVFYRRDGSKVIGFWKQNKLISSNSMQN